MPKMSMYAGKPVRLNFVNNSLNNDYLQRNKKKIFILNEIIIFELT